MIQISTTGVTSDPEGVARLRETFRAVNCVPGNTAYNQLQLDVYGEIIDMLYLCRQAGIRADPKYLRE